MTFCTTVVKSFYLCLTDFDFVYYSSYMVSFFKFIHTKFVVLLNNRSINPPFLLRSTHPRLPPPQRTEKRRSSRMDAKKHTLPILPSLYNYRILLCRFYFFFFLIFTVFGYVFLADHYEAEYEGACYELWSCFFKTFDWTFKENAGVGGFLTDPEEPPIAPVLDTEDGETVVLELINERYLARFLYDNLYTWSLIIIMINMVAGIIIDTFGSLKAQDLEKEKNYE